MANRFRELNEEEAIIYFNGGYYRGDCDADDTPTGGRCEREIRYVALFDRCGRVEDFRTA